ncbi:MAG: hypothetical protein ACWGOV_03125 [Acidiferrobacterales bacterium]
MSIKRKCFKYFSMPIVAVGMLFFNMATVFAEDNLAGVYVGEQSGPYLQNRLSSRTAMMFSLTAVNSDYWVSGDLKYYLGDYANSMYLTGGLTYAQQQGYPSETYLRAGGGWEFAAGSNMVYGIGATAWWSQSWPQPVVRGGVYIAFYR